jgi:hypothetical protein
MGVVVVGVLPCRPEWLMCAAVTRYRSALPRYNLDVLGAPRSVHRPLLIIDIMRAPAVRRTARPKAIRCVIAGAQDRCGSVKKIQALQIHYQLLHF